MTKRNARGLFAAMISVFLVLAIVPSASAADTEIAERAYQEIQDCVSRPGAQLNVLYVVDESGSLTESDPNAVRAAVLAQSLNQLGEISRNRDVFTSVAMFAQDFRVVRPWVELSPAVAQEESEWARSTVGSLVDGTATNWLAALEGAAVTMDSSPDAQTACKVVVWMTDGAIVMPDGGPNTEEALTQICAADPLTGQPLSDVSPVVAQLRTSGVNLIGVLLRAGTNSPEAESLLTFMRPIVEGEGVVDLSGLGSNTPAPFDLACGQAPIPADQAAGALIEADDPLDLAFKFATISLRIAGGSESGVNPGPPATFDIDAGVGRFFVLIAGNDWTLDSPDGTLSITEETATDDISVVPAGGLRTVQVTGDAVEEGTWTVRGGEGLVQLFVYSGLELSLETTEAFLNEPSELRFTILDQGVAIDNLDVYRPTTLNVSVSEPGAASESLSCIQEGSTAAFTCAYTPNRVGDVTVIARLPLTTLGGIELQPVPFEDSLRVQPPADYPQVREPDNATGVHEFTALVGRRGVAQGTFTLEAPAKGTGEICFPDAADVVISIDPQPERIPDYNFTGLPDTCIALAAGTTSTVTMQITNPVSANGNVEGYLIATLKSGERSETATQEIVFGFASDRKNDPPLLVLAGLGLVGLLIPIGLLYLQSFRAARLDLR